MSIQKSANLFEIKAHEKFYRRHMVDLPRIKFFVQHRYRANWPFMDGHLLTRSGTEVNHISLLPRGGDRIEFGIEKSYLTINECLFILQGVRTKDEEKQEALFESTVKVVNAIGFASSSVAKIAKEASVSSATLYVYHKNKEDLLVSTYLTIKQHLSVALLEGFDPDRPIRDILETAWFNAFRFATQHEDYFQFAEQFSNSPYADLIDNTEVEKYFDPIIQVLQRGIEQKIIKDVGFGILRAFMFYPIIALSNSRLCVDFEINDDNIKTAFNLAWDAIKL